MKLECFGEVNDVWRMDDFVQKVENLGYEAEVLGNAVKTIVEGSAETHSALVDAYEHLPVHMVAQATV